MGIPKLDEIGQIKGAIPLQKYEQAAVETDKFDEEDVTPILLGLYGEVGSIMAASKKYRREKEAYTGYKHAVEEEFGDALWYFAALCRRLSIELADVFESASDQTDTIIISANDQENAPISQIIKLSQTNDNLDKTLLKLGQVTAQILYTEKDGSKARDNLIHFARLYLHAIQSIGLTFASIVKTNLKKTLGRFSDLETDKLPDFDIDFPEEEQLPSKFEIHITQRESGQSYLQWNGVFIGSPLTDNISKPDGYRFHDIFHLAHAAILHWSPTFRALIKHKRKSDPVVDETQDGGRAIVIEEGLSAWLYSYAKDVDYFKGHKSVSFDILKTIQKFVKGYEVDQCPLNLWERAILEGYKVFRKVRDNEGGIVIGDRKSRTISYQPFGK
ncbi:MAG: nucleoside triphosphate pyrophosphohydrolase family protein [Pseudomonadota bacterium]